MSEQKKTKPIIEDNIPEYIDESIKKSIQDFAAYLRENKMQPVWNHGQEWWSSYKGEVICVIQLPLPVNGYENTWLVNLHLCHINQYEELVTNEGLQNIILDNEIYCVHGSDKLGVGCSPNSPCIGGETRTILNKEIKGICRRSSKSTRIWTPDQVTLDGIKRLLEIEKKARDEENLSEKKIWLGYAQISEQNERDPYPYVEQKNTRPKIEDVACEFLDGEKLKNALNFVAYLRTNKMSPVWASWNHWRISSKGRGVCSVKIGLPGFSSRYNAWRIEFQSSGFDDEKLLPDERLKEIVWANVKNCKHCANCIPTPCKTILGKEFERSCNIEFWNPGIEEIECAKQVIQVRLGL